MRHYSHPALTYQVNVSLSGPSTHYAHPRARHHRKKATFVPDVIQVLRSTKLEFVRTEHEGDDIHSLFFTLQSRFRHRAGQHGLFFASKVSMHPFTLANAPHEDYVILGTHLREGSAFKHRLGALEPGDVLTMRGPMQDFTIDDSCNSATLVAQGIGITPSRSILLDIRHRRLTITTELIHIGSTHPYRSLTESLADHSQYPTRRDEFTGQIERLAKAAASDNAFYLSGASSFVKEVAGALRGHGVRKSMIKTDAFLGY